MEQGSTGQSGVREHIWKMELMHCIFSGAMVFMISWLAGESVFPSGHVDEDWFVFSLLVMLVEVALLSLVLYAATFVSLLRTEGAVGMASCITAGIIVGGLLVFVLGASYGALPPIFSVLWICGSGGTLGLIYRLCQNSHFNPAVNISE